MFITPKLFHALLAATVLFATRGFASETAQAASDIKVMSYNVRYGTAKDEENAWENRKVFMAEAIKALAPDFLGTQETLGFQRDYLAEVMPTHEVQAAGREDGQEKGEMAAMFWRKDRFEKLEGGHFWLSETPAEVGSMGWDTALTRMASWVRLKDKGAPEAKPVLWVNTHFDHKGKVARVESAKLIRDRIETMGKDCSLIVTGDFNSGEGSPPYRALFGERENEQSSIVDTLRVAHPAREKGEGTTTPFSAVPNTRARIDWIGVSRDWQVIGAAIERPDREGKTPSDHFPVTAVLRR